MPSDEKPAVETAVIELCFADPRVALDVAIELEKKRSTGVLEIRTGTDLTANTSVLHLIVNADTVKVSIGDRTFGRTSTDPASPEG